MQVSLRLVKQVLEWLQHMQSFNPRKTDEQLVLNLQPYLSSSVEKVLRVQALMVIRTSTKEIAHNFFVLSTEDMEFLKSQLSHATDFSSLDVLQLLLSLSQLSQNLEMMSVTNLLSSLVMIFEGDKNVMEQEIAAQSIVEYEDSTNEEVKEVLCLVCIKSIYIVHVIHNN